MEQEINSLYYAPQFLPWAGLIAPGVVLNENGSYQRSFAYHGPDLDSFTEAEMVTFTARFNTRLEQLNSGWEMFFEAQRIPVRSFPAGRFVDPASWLVEEQGDQFENRFLLTFVYLPPPEIADPTERIFQEGGDPFVESDHVRSHLNAFLAETDRTAELMSPFLPKLVPLDDTQTLTYLHGTRSTEQLVVDPPQVPLEFGAFLDDTSLAGDVALDKVTANEQLGKPRRQKRNSDGTVLREVMLNREAALVDNYADNNATDANSVLQELDADDVAFGHVTTSPVISDRDQQSADEQLLALDRILNGRGSSTIREALNPVETKPPYVQGSPANRANAQSRAHDASIAQRAFEGVTVNADRNQPHDAALDGPACRTRIDFQPDRCRHDDRLHNVDSTDADQSGAGCEGGDRELNSKIAKTVADMRAWGRQSFGNVAKTMMILPRFRNQTQDDRLHRLLEPLIQDRVAIAYLCGKEGIGFDHLEINAWNDEGAACNGRPAQTGYIYDGTARKRRGSPGAAAFGISTNASADGVFAKALEQVASKKLNDMSPGCRRKFGRLKSTASNQNATSNRRHRDTCSKNQHKRSIQNDIRTTYSGGPTLNFEATMADDPWRRQPPVLLTRTRRHIETGGTIGRKSMMTDEVQKTITAMFKKAASTIEFGDATYPFSGGPGRYP